MKKRGDLGGEMTKIRDGRESEFDREIREREGENERERERMKETEI